jgi:hypothetical protein
MAHYPIVYHPEQLQSGQSRADRVTATYHFQCKMCDATEVEKFTMGLDLGAEPKKPSIPLGWVVIEGFAYCPRHIVEITIRDKSHAEGDPLLLARERAKNIHYGRG